MNGSVGFRAAGVRYAAVAGLPLASIAVAASACARALPPPGGEQDDSPPAVLSVTPAPMSTIAPTDEPVVIVFDERISERDIEEAVYVSPSTGAVDLSKGRRDLEIGVAGGWQPNRVYRVVVRPTLRDLFSNSLAAPIEIAFSTGAPFSDAALAGIVYERVTGAPVRDARVEARPADGGDYHLALTDSAGIFRMPLVPPGTYVLRAYADQNRDRRRDEYELGDSLTVALGATDTLVHPLALMRADTSAARLTRAEVVDSMTLRLSFDDYMDVRAPQIDARVQVRALPDSTVVPLAGVHYPHALRAQRARRDSIRADSLAAVAAAADSALVADSAAPQPAAPQRGAPARPAAADSAARDTLPVDALTALVRAAALRPTGDSVLPARELMVVFDRPIVPEAEYVVEVTGILNLSGIPGGGGTSAFEAPPAPPPPPAEERAPAGEAQAPAAEAQEPAGEAQAPAAEEQEPAAEAQEPPAATP